MALSVVSSGVDSVRFRKRSVNVVADRFRGWPQRGVHAQLAPPRRAPMLLDESQASASLTPSSSRHFPLCRSLPRERGDREHRDAAEPNPPTPSALVQFL